MEGAVAILLILLAVMFCIGVASGILSVIFTIKKIHPVASIILAIVCWLGVTSAVNLTFGILIGGLFMILFGAFVGVITAKSVKNMKQNKK